MTAPTQLGGESIVEAVVRRCMSNEEVPQDLKAFFGHPLTAATTAINGDDAASELALLHEYHNLPAIDRSDLKIRDKYAGLLESPSSPEKRCLASNSRLAVGDEFIVLGDGVPNVDYFFNTTKVAEENNKPTSPKIQFSLADSPQKDAIGGPFTNSQRDERNNAENLSSAKQTDNITKVCSVTNEVSSTQQGFEMDSSSLPGPPQLDFQQPINNMPRIETPSKEHTDDFSSEPLSLLPYESDDGDDANMPPILDDMTTDKNEKGNNNNNNNSEEVIPTIDKNINEYVKNSTESTKKIIQMLNEKIRKKNANPNDSSEEQLHINEISQIMKEVLDRSGAKKIPKKHPVKKNTSKKAKNKTSAKEIVHTESASKAAPNMAQLLNQQNPSVCQQYPVVPQGIVPIQNVQNPGTMQTLGQQCPTSTWYPPNGQVPVRIMGPYPEWRGPMPLHMQSGGYPGPVYTGGATGMPQGHFYVDPYQPQMVQPRLPMPGPMYNDNQGAVIPRCVGEPNQVTNGMVPRYEGAPPSSIGSSDNAIGFNKDLCMPPNEMPNTVFTKDPNTHADNNGGRKGKGMKRKQTQATIVLPVPFIPTTMTPNPQQKPTYTPSFVISKRDPDPTGYVYHIETPISKGQRIEEEKITYLNKGQYYGITMEFQDNGRKLQCNTVKSLIMVLFRDDKDPENDMKAWDFWYARQHSQKQRILDVDNKNSSGIVGGCADDIATNAVVVRWNPREQPAKVMFTINCLSTDFSNQKGVKGLALHLQIDTCEEVKNDVPIHRGYCQVKIFCDKGAERKTRDEERRKDKARYQPELTRKKDSEAHIVYHKSEERSKFYSMADRKKMPLLFRPVPEYERYSSHMHKTLPPAAVVDSESADSTSVDSSDTQNKRYKSSHESTSLNTMLAEQQKVLLYVRDEHESVFTALLLHSSTLLHLSQAIEEKYDIPTHKLRNIYKKGKKGILVRMDDNILRHYANESTFIIDIDQKSDQWDTQSHYYDITFTEISE